MERKSKIARKTKETDIKVELVLDSTRESSIKSGVPFFDHMLGSLAKHGRFFINLECIGDNHIDDHHSVEDVGIVLGSAFREAIGEAAGITRFGDASVPMDEALASVSIDLSGRPYFSYKGPQLKGYIGNYSEELTSEFLRAFAVNAGINLHVTVHYGENSHHIHEAIYKAAAVALFRAASIDPMLKGLVPSTKGILT